MMLDNVDLIFPFHQDNEFLTAAISSAQNSHGVEVRIIAINDSGKIFSKSELGLRETDLLVSSQEKGYRGALATGMALTHAEYISFLDSDDLLHPDKLQIQLKALIEQGADLATGRIVRFNTSIEDIFNSPLSIGLISRLSQREKLVFGAYGADSSIMLRASTLKESWGIHATFPARLSDYGWLLSVLPSKRTIHCEESIYFYRTHPGQMSRFGNLKSEWLEIQHLWMENLRVTLGRYCPQIFSMSPAAMQAIAFPTSLPKLSLREKRSLKSTLSLLREVLQEKYPGEIKEITELVGVRLAIAHRGVNPRYLLFTLRILRRTLVTYLKGNRKRST